MKVVRVLLIIIAILMVIPLGFGVLTSMFFIEPVVKSNFSNNQINEICSKLKFEIKPDEKIFIEYYPTVLQATTYLEISIENVESEADFLSRFHGVVKPIESYQGYDRKTYFRAYNVEIFQLERIPKDYWCTLFFAAEDGSVRAVFYVSGYIGELKNIYNYFLFNFKPLFVNPMFVIPLIIEIVLLFIIIIIPILRKRSNRIVN